MPPKGVPSWLSVTEGTRGNYLVRMLRQESEMRGHVLLTFGQPLRLVLVYILELNDEHHRRLPSLA